jgi:periplasmic protein TonB
MPLNVRRIFASFFLVVFGFTFVYSQETAVNTPPVTSAPTAAEVMNQRVAKAKAYIVLKNYNAAIYELENIRRETRDANIHAMLNVLLMHSFLEQSDYKRAQTLLDTLHKDLKANKPNAAANYYAVAGQIVKGAKNQLERYRSIGLSVADRNLPLEAVADIEKMRETLETVVAQTKSLSADKQQTTSALMILEEAVNARGALAKDDYDANRWRREIADARESMINSRSIINAVDGTTESASPNTAASNVSAVNAANSPATNTKAPENAPKTIPPPAVTETALNSAATTAKTETPQEIKKPDEAPKQNQTVANNAPNQPERNRAAENLQETKTVNPPANKELQTETAANTTAQIETAKSDSPLAVGSLIEYATKRVNPVYPVVARSVRMTGVVRVDVVIDEAGNVVEVQNTNGPGMLQRAALDAIRKWQFKPFVRDGQPVKAAGFVNFNFSL